MKDIEIPPIPKEHDRSFSELISITHKTALAALFQKTNQEYLYWTQFKHLSFPEGISPELAWLTLKDNRNAHRKFLPFQDKTAVPFSYWQPDSVQEGLNFIDINAGGQILTTDGVLTDQNKQHHLFKSLQEEAIASSQLEGAATTRQHAKEILQRKITPRTKAERMIVNNYRTIQDIRELLDQPLSAELILRIHQTITEGTLEDPASAGRFRTPGEDIYVQKDGHVRFIPPDATQITSYIETLCKFANAETPSYYIHPVIRAIIIHFMLAYAHPFVDGNGRTARALFYWYVLKQKYWLFEYLSISRVILHAPSQYERAFLYTEHDDADLTYFISFHINVIMKAIADVRTYLEVKQRVQTTHQHLLLNHPELNERQRALIIHALENPAASYTVTEYQSNNQVAYETARRDLMMLQKMGLMIMRKSGKKFYFIAPDNLKKLLQS